MRSCRTASVFAMGGVLALLAIDACHEAALPEIPPLTTASPDAAPLLGESASASASAKADGGADDAAAPVADAPVRAKLVDTPSKLDAALCKRTLVSVVKGKVTALGETLGPGDVLVVQNGESFETTGAGTVVWAEIPIAVCPVRARPLMSKTVVRANAAPRLAWAGGAMSAHLDVPRASALSPELYLGRLEGTAPVAEHIHAESWEILAVIEGKGTLALGGTDLPVAPRQLVVIPPGTKHAYKPAAGSNLVAVQMYAPPGPEQRFVALAAAAQDVKDAGVADAH